MNPTGHLNSERLIGRRAFLQMLEAALDTQTYRFARLASLNWLAMFPGDLKVSLILGEAQLGEGNSAQAIQILEKLCTQDPEFIEARLALIQAYQAANHPQLASAQACYYVLGGDIQWNNSVFEWGANLYAARKAMTDGDLDLADRLLNQVMAMKCDLPLVALTHIQLAAMQNRYDAVYQLASSYHASWPDCIAFKLYLAEAEIERGDEAKAVSLLHLCVASDSAAQVAYRIWGSDHRYRPLWPDTLEIYFDLPIPAPVAGRLGLNQLPSGPLPETPAVDRPATAETPAMEPPAETVQLEAPPQAVECAPSAEAEDKSAPGLSPETILSVEETFGRLAKKMKNPALGRSDGRCPVYVILSTRTGLEKAYGKQTAAELVNLMAQLSDAVNRRPGWGAALFLPDDIDQAAKFELKAIDAVDPWKIKLALADLDKALAKKGQMIGALLIAGGPEIVPFHRLPNPTDDSDKDVPSDNPYATLDSNYFVPEWPMGRLASETSADAGLLLEQLRNTIAFHSKSPKSAPALTSIIAWLLEFLKSRSAARRETGFGYTAEVWRQSSVAVYKTLGGEPNKMLSCPPEVSTSIPTEKVSGTALEYFNLHGIEDGAEWYGQKDVNSTSNGPDYPVALSPHNLVKNGHSPSHVFTEACYGANVIGKKEDEALALKFLSIGAKAFIGSTTISYGSVAEPLIGADLLGSLFWKSLKEGLSTGEALMQAKIGTVQEMTRRQGYLDGEDQKTLISFVLYGDPLLGYDSNAQQPKALLRSLDHPKVKMICDRMEAEQGMQPVSAKVLNEVKMAVAEYLPGLGPSEIVISCQHEACDGENHHCPASELGEKEKSPAVLKERGVVITVSKKVQEAQHVHVKYARVTLNSGGKMVKLAVSR